MIHGMAYIFMDSDKTPRKTLLWTSRLGRKCVLNSNNVRNCNAHCTRLASLERFVEHESKTINMLTKPTNKWIKSMEQIWFFPLKHLLRNIWEAFAIHHPLPSTIWMALFGCCCWYFWGMLRKTFKRLTVV